MWHFILPFTDKHHADCHLRKLSCLWKSEDVGMIILMGDESSFCCIRKTVLVKKLYQPSSRYGTLDTCHFSFYW